MEDEGNKDELVMIRSKDVKVGNKRKIRSSPYKKKKKKLKEDEGTRLGISRTINFFVQEFLVPEVGARIASGQVLKAFNSWSGLSISDQRWGRELTRLGIERYKTCINRKGVSAIKGYRLKECKDN